MKKFMIMAVVAAAVSFTSCKKDDDATAEEVAPVLACKTCEIPLLGLATEYCDNGDGTVKVTLEGISQNQDLEGLTFDQFIKSFEASGATCK